MPQGLYDGCGESNGLPSGDAHRPRRLAPPTWEESMESWRKWMSEPFLDDEVMDSTPPSCEKKDFRLPRLRRCPVDIGDIKFVGRVNPGGNHYTNFREPDGGLDGYNWKVRLEKGGPTRVMKMFWDTDPPPPSYFAAQRECQNAALLQMIAAALSDSQHGPILIDPNPDSETAAKSNLRAFSNEVRQKRRVSTTENLVSITTVPRMRKCYGWLKFSSNELDRMPRSLFPPVLKLDLKTKRCMYEGMEYTAVVYEYIEEGENKIDDVKSVLDFLWQVGFAFPQLSKENNWKSGVLIDHSDIVAPGWLGWQVREYGPRRAKGVLWSVCPDARNRVLEKTGDDGDGKKDAEGDKT